MSSSQIIPNEVGRPEGSDFLPPPPPIESVLQNGDPQPMDLPPLPRISKILAQEPIPQL